MNEWMNDQHLSQSHFCNAHKDSSEYDAPMTTYCKKWWQAQRRLELLLHYWLLARDVLSKSLRRKALVPFIKENTKTQKTQCLAPKVTWVQRQKDWIQTQLCQLHHSCSTRFLFLQSILWTLNRFLNYLQTLISSFKVTALADVKIYQPGISWLPTGEVLALTETSAGARCCTRSFYISSPFIFMITLWDQGTL